MRNLELLCMGCMKIKPNDGICPHCNFDLKKYYDEEVRKKPHHLKPQTILNGRYMVGKVLGEGGFGITYIAWDFVEEIPVAIKEYFLVGFVTRDVENTDTVSIMLGGKEKIYQKQMERFLGEANTLAKFDKMEAIVSIKDCFSENKTSYIVMEYLDGEDFVSFLQKNGGSLPIEMVCEMMKPVMRALIVVHKNGLIHRDISPDNIRITSDARVKLMDFGAARETSSGDKSLSILLKPGYAPEEQYRSRGKQGPWTDVYALCATIYRAVTGKRPMESLNRMAEDTLEKPSELGIEIENPALESALMKGLGVFAKNRFQSVEELYKAFFPDAPEEEYLPPEEKTSHNETSHKETSHNEVSSSEVSNHAAKGGVSDEDVLSSEENKLNNLHDLNLLCMGCMKIKPHTGVCPYCHFDFMRYQMQAQGARFNSQRLQAQTILNGRYMIGRTLGENRFGITYIGWDLNSSMAVAVREYFPIGCLGRKTARSNKAYFLLKSESDKKLYLQQRSRFIREAEVIEKLENVKSIVSMKDIFIEDGIAYVVMEYLEGENFRDFLKKNGGKISVERTFEIMRPIMKALMSVHKNRFLHNDMNPSSIRILPNGEVKLIDFGVIREESFKDYAITVRFRQGCMPIEKFMPEKKQGPWSDIYGVCATIYLAITGEEVPSVFVQSKKIEVKRPSEMGVIIDRKKEDAIMKGLEIEPKKRWRNIAQLYEIIYSEKLG